MKVRQKIALGALLLGALGAVSGAAAVTGAFGAVVVGVVHVAGDLGSRWSGLPA